MATLPRFVGLEPCDADEACGEYSKNAPSSPRSSPYSQNDSHDNDSSGNGLPPFP